MDRNFSRFKNSKCYLVQSEIELAKELLLKDKQERQEKAAKVLEDFIIQWEKEFEVKFEISQPQIIVIAK